jgi:hypothetical protein
MAMTLEQYAAIKEDLPDWCPKEYQSHMRELFRVYDAHLIQPAQAVDVTDEDVEAAGAAYFEQQWDMLPSRSKAIYRNALRRALKSFAARALSAEKAGWRDIATAPKDELILVGPTKRMGICVAMHHSRDGWVTETCSEWSSIYTPTHWMPLPASPTPDKEQPNER